MPKFGKRSMKNLSEAHWLLQELFLEVIEHYDCTVIEGYRGKEEQNKAFYRRSSNVKWPNSKHNKKPSMAVDVCPYPIDWEDRERFFYLSGIVFTVAAYMGINIRWGADWNMDKKFNNHDLPHFELVDDQL